MLTYSLMDFLVLKLLFVFMFMYFRFYITLWFLFTSFFYYIDFIYLHELAIFLVFFILYFNFFVLFYSGELFYLNIFNFFIIFFGLFFSLFLCVCFSPFYVCSFLYIGSGLVFIIRFILCSLEILSLHYRLPFLFLWLLCNSLSLHLLTHFFGLTSFTFCFYSLDIIKFVITYLFFMTIEFTHDLSHHYLLSLHYDTALIEFTYHISIITSTLTLWHINIIFNFMLFNSLLRILKSIININLDHLTHT
jgi:hypothetical protein